MHNQDDEITPIPPPCEKSNEVVQTVEVDDSTLSIEDRPEPTDEELETLRRVSETIPLRAWYFPMR
jgi:hypothetical protein